MTDSGRLDAPASLDRSADRVVPPDRLLAELVPPRHFADESFATYRPDPAHPSQARGGRPGCPQAADADPARAVAVVAASAAGRRRSRSTSTAGSASARPTCSPRSRTRSAADAAYGTFVEYTNLVGALGFLPTVEALATRRLVCIDEFELDDPGDTVLMSRLLRELADRGVALAATSNTLPGSLGEGRFAADDFLREIQALAARFEVLRVDGDDYRHRSRGHRRRRAAGRRRSALPRPRATDATLDDFGDLLAHLATVHPSRYGALLDGVGLVALTGVQRRAHAGRRAAARRAGRPALRPGRARAARRRGGAGPVLAPRCSPAATARSTTARCRGSARSPRTAPRSSPDPARVRRAPATDRGGRARRARRRASARPRPGPTRRRRRAGRRCARARRPRRRTG